MAARTPRLSGPASPGGWRCSGDQDGPAGELSRDGFVVDGGEFGEGPPRGDVDLQFSGVDAGGEAGEPGGVGVEVDGNDPDAASGVAGVGERGADEGTAVGGESGELCGFLGAGADEVEHDVEPLTGQGLGERFGGVVDDAVGAVVAEPAGAAAAGGGGDGGAGLLRKLDGV